MDGAAGPVSPPVGAVAADVVPLAELVAAKGGARISVCLPARDEAATVGAIVAAVVEQLVERHGLVDEVVVVDDASTDDTAATARRAGARVLAAREVLAGCGPATGKGEAMWKSVAGCSGELIVWCDADIRNFDPRFVTGLLGPLLSDPSVQFVKGCYRRDLDGRLGEGGRVTELVARPLLNLLFPHLANFAQPLAGECAGRRGLLEQLSFAPGYGVDLGLLVDVAAVSGVGTMSQVDLGQRSHRNRPLHELAAQAEAVMATALALADIARGRGTEASRHGWRPPLVEVPAYRDRGRPPALRRRPNSS
ncbi:MAG: glucosyl-3-phosphoglycerate synthase [Acidimicrobiales bacterium]